MAHLSLRKRMFFAISFIFDMKKQRFCKMGSITAETAIVMPLFIFLLINIVTLFQMISIHTSLDSALTQVAREISTFACFQEAYENVLLSEVYVKERVIQTVGRDVINNSVVVGGTSGIVLWRSEVIEENDVIDLVMTYRVRPMFPVFNIGEMTLVNRCYIKAYTGYEKEEYDSERQRYYVAENGEVYHLHRSCTHLQLSISMLNVNELAAARNDDGSRYSPCEVCYDAERSGNRVYITTQGDRYHSSVACTGLKRTIYVISASGIGTKALCTRCGGG